MEEIWTLEAKQTFSQNVDFLVDHWSIKVANSFITKSVQLINLLKKNPELGQFDEKWQAHKFLVVPQIYLFYEVQGEKLILLSFWNNFQKPLF